MASNRSRSTSRPAAQAVSKETTKGALTAVARHTARIQVAALGAAGNAVAGWASSAEKFAQSVGDELLRLVDGECDSRELIVHVASATNVHLRELTTLPSAATDHFNTRLARVSTNR
jgi:hypothetical protein